MRAHHHKLNNLGPSPAAVTWREQAKCGDTSIDPRLFDEPDLPAGLTTKVRLRQVNAQLTMAREHCDTCPVAAQCLELGTSGRGSGVYAGVLLQRGEAVPTREPVPS